MTILSVGYRFVNRARLLCIPARDNNILQPDEFASYTFHDFTRVFFIFLFRIQRAVQLFGSSRTMHHQRVIYFFIIQCPPPGARVQLRGCRRPESDRKRRPRRAGVGNRGRRRQDGTANGFGRRTAAAAAAAGRGRRSAGGNLLYDCAYVYTHVYNI